MKGGKLKKVGIGVASLFIILALVWFFVVDLVVEMVIESEGTKAAGAKVEVAKADLSLFPASIEIKGLEVTDPDSPMTNAVTVKRIFSDIEIMPLIKSKVIINEMRMEGIRFNTPRKSSGAIPHPPGQDAAKKKNEMPPWLQQICEADNAPQFSIPTVESILAKENLQTLQAAKDLRNKIDAAKAQWQNRLKKLPTRKDFDAYQKRLKGLKASGGLTSFMGSATELQALRADLNKDLDRLKKAQKGFQAEINALKKQSSKLSKAPFEEAKRLKAKYALSPEGAANLSRTLFGPKACDWWKKGYQWYAILEPYLSNAGKESAPQDTPQPKEQNETQSDELPDFLIRQVHIDAAMDVGQFTGQISNITSDPQIVGKPMMLKFLGRELKQIQSVNIHGILDFIQPDNPKHNFKLLVQQYALQNLNLSESGDMPLSIVKAMTDIKMDLNLSGSKLDALVNAQLDKVQMAVEEAAGSELNSALSEVLKDVTRFGLTALIEGNNPDYITKIESDLDRILQKAVGKIVQKAGDKLESQLQSAISEKTKGPILEAQKKMGGLNSLGDEFTQRLNIGNNLFKNIKMPF